MPATHNASKGQADMTALSIQLLDLIIEEEDFFIKELLPYIANPSKKLPAPLCKQIKAFEMRHEALERALPPKSSTSKPKRRVPCNQS